MPIHSVRGNPFARPLTTACGGASPKGEALIGRYTFSVGDFSTAFGLRPLSGRNDIVKTEHTRCHFERQPRNPLQQKRHKTYTRQPTRPRWLTVEKSTTGETAQNIPAPARSPAGVPCRQRRSLPQGGSLNRKRTPTVCDK